MGFRQGAYACVWETKAGSGNWTDVRLSISKKNRDGDYETDFSGFVRFIGDAHKEADCLCEKTRIKIGECEVTNRYDKEKKVTYTNYAVFSFEYADGSGSAAGGSASGDGFANVPDVDEEDLPFN